MLLYCKQGGSGSHSDPASKLRDAKECIEHLEAANDVIRGLKAVNDAFIETEALSPRSRTSADEAAGLSAAKKRKLAMGTVGTLPLIENPNKTQQHSSQPEPVAQEPGEDAGDTITPPEPMDTTVDSTDEATSSAQNALLEHGRTELLDKRVAKYFNNADGETELFGGVVVGYVPANEALGEQEFWNIDYDDGDKEDVERTELVSMILNVKNLRQG